MMHVKITSFSYMDGYPADDSGHGGGFIFDCRAIYNPDRMVELRAYNGTQQPIIDYLDKQPDAQTFAKHAFALVDMAVKNYLTRGFDYLSVGFGCMGGKHRSVYMAERLAKHIHEKFPEVTAEIVHSKGW